MTKNKRFEVIRDFCDWLGYQGLAYAILYFGMSKDIEHLINQYLEDEEWHNKENGDDV